MKELYLNGITKTSEFEDEMFMEILEMSDQIERQKYIEAVRKKTTEVGRRREFDNLLKAWIQQHAQLIKQAESNVTQFTDAPLVLKCGKYRADDTGVKVAEVTKSGEIITYTACPHPILPVERMVNIDTDTEKAKLMFFKDGRWRSICVDCNTIFNKSKISELADRGIIVTSENAKDLVKYLAEVVSLNAEEIPLYRSIGRLGWIEKEFAPYAENVKYDGDLDFQNVYDCVQEQGEFDIWLEHMEELRRYKEIKIMLATSLASPLIEKVGALPFVLHLWGKTGFGKTVSLMIASSVWGNPDYGKLTRSMNMTANAMARTASFLYSIPFCADELQQIKDRWGNYDNLIMYLCEGVDRGRAKARGGVEQLATWRNAFIFTGEEPVTKNNSGGGVKNRCIEIEVKEQIITNGNKTAAVVKENYGHAGKKFIEHIQKIPDAEIQKTYKEIYNEIMGKVDTTEKQAYSMALILLADKYACESVLMHFKPLSIDDVKEYLTSAKSVDLSERAFDWLLGWIAENAIRFEEGNDNKGAIWGRFEKDGAISINKNVLLRAMNEQGFDFDACKKDWAKQGRLIKNSKGKFAHNTFCCGVRANFIKINTKDTDWVEVEDEETMPFM